MRQRGLAHEVEVDGAGGLPALGDGPDHQRLPPGRVASREHSGNAAHAVGVDGDVAPAVQSHADLRQHAVRLGVQEPHGQQGQLGLDLELAAGDLDHGGTAAVGPFLPLDPHRVQFLQSAVASREGLGQHRVVADAALFVGRRRPQDHGPLGPGVVGGSLVGRLGQQFQLVHHLGALTVGRAQTVGAGVSSAQDDHPFALGVDPFVIGYLFAGQHPVLLGEVLHGQVDSLQVSSRNVQFPGLGTPAGQADRVELGEQTVHRVIDADIGVGQEGDALFGHQVDAALDHALLQLEFGDAQDEKTADIAGPLNDRHQVPGAVQLLGGGQAGRAGPDHGNLLAGPVGRWLGLDPAVLKTPLDDLFLDKLDCDRVGIYAQDAAGLAGGGAYAAGELREIIGRQ